MTLAKHNAAVSIAGMALALSFGLVSAAGALTTSCVGVSSASNIVWTASATGGVAPIAFLWSNGSTSSAQTIAVAPGTYSMTIKATDASSSVATSTCSASVAATTTTSAGTSAIAAQIQALLAQIKTLQAQIVQLVHQSAGAGASSSGASGATSTPATGCLKFNKDLSFGDRGDDVKELQRALAHDPSILPPHLATGFFGHKTEEALQKFQRRFGTGSTTKSFGPNVRSIFRKHCNEKDLGLSASSTTSISDNHGRRHGKGDNDRRNRDHGEQSDEGSQDN